MSINVRFERNGKFVSVDDAQNCPILVSGGGRSFDPDLVTTFDTEGAYRTWARHSPNREQFLRLDLMIAHVQQHEKPDDDAEMMKTHRRRTERLRADFDALRARLGAKATFVDTFRVASLDAHLLEGPILDSMTLHQHADLAGKWVPIWNKAPIPKLSWLDFNDRTTSVLISGIGVLTQHSWFRGRRFYLAGFPLFEYSNLADRGFNNMASSAAVQGAD